MKLRLITEFRRGVGTLDPEGWPDTETIETVTLTPDDYLRSTDALTGRKGIEGSISRSDQIYVPNFLKSEKSKIGSIPTSSVHRAIQAFLEKDGQVELGLVSGFIDTADVRKVAKPMQFATGVPFERIREVHLVAAVNGMPLYRINSQGMGLSSRTRTGQRDLSQPALYDRSQVDPDPATLPDAVMEVMIGSQDFQAAPAALGSVVMDTKGKLGADGDSKIETHGDFVFIYDGTPETRARAVDAIDHFMANRQ
jgi:hypothetical protein